jgi:SAM-dependent methyltransferase
MADSRWSGDYEQARSLHDALWTAGDYPAIADRMVLLSQAVVNAAGVGEGLQVLDAGAGAGNTAILAAKSGADVISGDLTSDLFDVCRRRADEARLSVQWLELNPEQLPFPDQRFDRVVSAVSGWLALMPDAARVGSELIRVLREGGRFALASWTVSGTAGEASRAMARYLPPPAGAPSPWTWGTVESVQTLLGQQPVDFAIHRASLRFVDRSAEEFVEFMTRAHGPTIMAKQATEAQRTWQQLRRDLVEVYASSAADDAADGLAFEQEYLLVVGTRR